MPLSRTQRLANLALSIPSYRLDGPCPRRIRCADTIVSIANIVGNEAASSRTLLVLTKHVIQLKSVVKRSISSEDVRTGLLRRIWRRPSASSMLLLFWNVSRTEVASQSCLQYLNGNRVIGDGTYQYVSGVDGRSGLELRASCVFIFAGGAFALVSGFIAAFGGGLLAWCHVVVGFGKGRVTDVPYGAR